MERHEPEFARYDPQRPRVPAMCMQVRMARPGDAPAVAALASRHSGAEPARIQPAILAEYEALANREARRLCLLAFIDESLVGYGRARWMEPDPQEGARNAPPGWYLNGLLVSPQIRRQGVGEALTLGRLGQLRELGASEVFYFSNSANQASIDLHLRLGFSEMTRDFAFPGVHFFGTGVGVLFRLPLPVLPGPGAS